MSEKSKTNKKWTSNEEFRSNYDQIFGKKKSHSYYKCLSCKDEGHCQFCDGGLLYCTVCKCGESELAEECPGDKQ